MQRQIFATLSCLVLAFALGCGSRSAPDQQNNHTTPDGGVELSTSPTLPGEPVKPTYQLDTSKHVIPTGLVLGNLAGENVVAEAHIEGHKLVFQKRAELPGESWQVWIELPPEALRGEPYRLVVKPDQTPGVRSFVEFPKPVMVKQPTGYTPTRFFEWHGGCALTLELGKMQNGKVPGKVYLALGEVPTQSEAQRQTFLAGTFEAARPRRPADPPTEEDVPFINGSVSVQNAPPEALLTVGYISMPTAQSPALGTAQITLGEPINPPRWTQVEYDKPRVTNLIAGDGKNVPSRYEHSRLTPGRYLVFASLKDGPAAWKWVNVGAKATIAADLTINATQTGGLEVQAPLGALKVQLAPAEEPGHPLRSDSMFISVVWQLGLERDVVSRKVLYRNLAPGKYEVRSGGEVRIVEITAGKTIELDYDKPPPDPKIIPEPAPDPKEKP
jgi:hypothetical protein